MKCGIFAGLAVFQFTSDSKLVLELTGLVSVCLELVTPQSNLEREVNVFVNTEDDTAQGDEHFVRSGS